MSEILSREDAARAFLDGKELELNYKGNKGFEGGWVPLLSTDDFWAILGRDNCDWRVRPIKPIPKARFMEGEFAYLVKADEALCGARYAYAFRHRPEALFVRIVSATVPEHASEGWRYEVVDDEGTPQTAHERDLSKASEVAPILIDE